MLCLVAVVHDTYSTCLVAVVRDAYSTCLVAVVHEAYSTCLVLLLSLTVPTYTFPRGNSTHQTSVGHLFWHMCYLLNSTVCELV